MGNGRESRNIEAISDSIRHMEPQTRFMMNDILRRTRQAALREVITSDLPYSLLIVQCHEKLIGIRGSPWSETDATIRYGLVDQGKLKLFVVLVEQQPIIEGEGNPLRWRRHKRERNHVPSTAWQVWQVGPLSRKQL